MIRVIALLCVVACADPPTRAVVPHTETTMALVVNAGSDQIVHINSAAVINATITGAAGPLRNFWRKISGPGQPEWAHEFWRDGGETGGFENWLRPDQFGFVKGAFEGGIHVAGDKAYSGQYSIKARNDPALTPPQNHNAKITRWAFTEVLSDGMAAYSSAWYWWPPGYVAGGPTPPLIMQWKAMTAPNDPVMPIFGKTFGAPDIINIFDWQLSVAHNNGAAVFPKGSWFNLTTYMKVSRTVGELGVWLDGVRIYNLLNQNTLGPVSNNNPAALMWGVANYANQQATIDNPLWVDDASVVGAASNQLVTTVRFPQPGVYVLRLTGDDGIETIHDDVQITVVGSRGVGKRKHRR